jgi:hypothetical protein
VGLGRAPDEALALSRIIPTQPNRIPVNQKEKHKQIQRSCISTIPDPRQRKGGRTGEGLRDRSSHNDISTLQTSVHRRADPFLHSRARVSTRPRPRLTRGALPLARGAPPPAGDGRSFLAVCYAVICSARSTL